MLESKFKKNTTEEIRELFPGCIILKNDANYLYGVPDMLILFKDRWAMLEFKQAAESDRQANQDFYIKLCNEMSYASFIYPEIKEKVLDELQQTFRYRRPARLPKR